MLVDPGPESSVATLIEALGDERAARAAAHPHPPRPRRRDRRARAPLARLGSTSTSAARRTSSTRRSCWRSAGRLYGEDDMDRLWGEIVPVPEENIAALARRRDRRGLPRRLHARARLAPRRATCTRTGRAFIGDVAGVRIRRDHAHRAAHAAARHRRRGVARSRSTPSQAWDPARLRSPTSARTRTSRRTSTRLRAALRNAADWRATSTRTSSRARRRAWADNAPVLRAGSAVGPDVAGARALLAQAGRA